MKLSDIRDRLGRHELPIIAFVLGVVLVGIVLAIPNTQAVRADLAYAAMSVARWLRGAVVFLFVYAAPIALGILVFARGMQVIDGIISRQFDMGGGKRFILSLIIALIVGAAWLFVLPAAVKVPEFGGMLLNYGWRVSWEIAAWWWGLYATATFMASYILSMWLKSVSG